MASANSAGVAISHGQKLLWAGALLIAYALVATWGRFDFGDLMGYYDMLADGFLQGHLYIPYAPTQHAIHDMVPFEGHYYMQWGPFPAVLHWLPRLVGLRLSDRVACILAGWLTSLVFFEIILRLRQRHFQAMPEWLFRWFFLAFALGTPTILVAGRGTVYNESIGIGMLCVLLGFLFFLEYIGKRNARWAGLTGLTVALAIMTRVTLAFYAAGLFAATAALDWPWKQPIRAALLRLAAFTAPVTAAVLLMLAYNQARFHSPWEYGGTYLIEESRLQEGYHLLRVPENFRHYVMAPIRVTRHRPWLQHTGWPPLYYTTRAEDMSSMFIASPFLLLVGLASSFFRSRDPHLKPIKVFTAAAGLCGLVTFFSLLCFIAASRRYMQDFVPMFAIVAFVAVAYRANCGTDWHAWQKVAWMVLAFSAAIHVHLVLFQNHFWQHSL